MSRRNAWNRRLAVCVLSLCCLSCHPHIVWSQAAPMMPNGWQSLGAAEFLAAADAFFAAGGDASPQRAEVVSHAWSQFLGSEAFVTSGPWDTVRHMVEVFGWRRAALVTGETFAEQDASRADIDAELAVLKERFAARLSSESVSQNASFEELKNLRHVMQDNGFTKREQAALFSSWAGSHDWRLLSLADQFELFDGLSDDWLDFHSMSARWTGFLSAPQTGNYTLKQVRQYLKGTDAELQVWVSGQLVLDSSRGEGLRDDAAFQSAPVRMTANTPVPVRIELRHHMAHDPYYSDGTPIAALAWRLEGQMADSLVPQTAFTPPADFVAAGAQGLKAEYFSGEELGAGNLVEARLDPGFSFSWAWGPVVSAHRPLQDELVAQAKGKLLNADYLRSLDTSEARAEYLNSPGWRYSHYLTLEERQQYVETLLQQTELLAEMSPYAMGKLFETLYMLPGKEQLELLAVWSDLAGQPRLEIGDMPGSGPGKYETKNTEFYWLIGNFLQGPYAGDVDLLLQDYLRRNDGSCDLRIARVATYAADLNGQVTTLRNRIQTELTSGESSADVRVTWLLGLAFVEDIAGAHAPRPHRGLPHAEEAYLTAQSSTNKFWAAQEIVARLVSAGDFERARILLTGYQSTFSAPAQRSALATWSNETTRVENVYEARSSARQLDPLNAFIVELNRRLERAQAKGVQVRVARLESKIRAAVAKLRDNP